MRETSLLLVKRTGNSVLLRSRFLADQDLLLTLGFGSNRQIGFCGLTDSTAPQKGIRFHSCGEIVRLGISTVPTLGGNHGCSDLREVVCTEHGLGETDLGSEWHDAAGALRLRDGSYSNKSVYFKPGLDRSKVTKFLKNALRSQR